MEHLYEYLARLEHKPRRSVGVIIYNFMNTAQKNTFFITKRRAKRYKGNR